MVIRTVKANLLVAFMMVISVMAIPAIAAKIKVKVQAKKDTDFSLYKTYAWLDHPPVARPVLALEVVGAVDEELKARGFTKAHTATTAGNLVALVASRNASPVAGLMPRAIRPDTNGMAAKLLR